MIVCVGDPIKMGHIVEALESRLHEEITFVPENYDIRKQENDILLAAQAARAIIYDTQQYLNDGEELVNIAKRIYRTNKAAVVLLVPTNHPNNEIVKAAVAQQIKGLVNTALSPGEQKEQLEKILASYYENNGREDLNAAERTVQTEAKTLNEFVGELYDAKQREDEKENTIIIRKKGTTQVLLDFLVGLFRVAFTVLSVILMAIAIITLLYTNTRSLFLGNMNQIVRDILAMF